MISGSVILKMNLHPAVLITNIKPQCEIRSTSIKQQELWWVKLDERKTDSSWLIIEDFWMLCWAGARVITTRQRFKKEISGFIFSWRHLLFFYHQTVNFLFCGDISWQYVWWGFVGNLKRVKTVWSHYCRGLVGK